MLHWLKFSWNEFFICARARNKKALLTAILLFTFGAVSQANHRDELFQKIKDEPAADKRVKLIAQISAAHPGNADIAKLADLLTDPHVMVRSQAVVALGATGNKNAAKHLENILRTDNDPGVRMSAAFWLGSFSGKSTLRALQDASQNDTNANVRRQAAQSLKKVANEP